MAHWLQETSDHLDASTTDAFVGVVVVALDALLLFAGARSLAALEACAPSVFRQCRAADVRLHLSRPVTLAQVAAVARVEARRVVSVASAESTERGCAGILEKAGDALEAFHQATRMDWGSLEVFARAAGSLTRLDCSKTRCDGHLDELRSLGRLRSLDLSQTYVEGDIGSIIHRLPQLETLHLVDATCITGDLPSLLRCGAGSSLRVVDVNGTGVEGCLSQALLRCRHLGLKLLDVSHSLVEGTLDGAERLADLTYLGATSCDLVGGLEPLGGLGALTYLNLSSNVLLQGALESLARCLALVHVDVSATQIQGDIGALRRCRRLFYLDVRSTACSGEAASLSGLPLRLLNVGYSRVRGTQVEAEAALPRCATLLGFRTT